MKYLLGIDLGTSSVKTCLIDYTGTECFSDSEVYSINTPARNWAEQDPEEWWRATKKTIQHCLQKVGGYEVEITGISFSGQMHGLVILDKDKQVIRPAIIWCDQRSQQQIHSIHNKIQKEEVGRQTLNALSPGFLLPSLMWIKDHEPFNYEKIDKVVLPKDYIRYRITGEIGTDSTDACGTLIFNIERREWAEDLIKKLGINRNLFPLCREPYEIAGYVTRIAANETGLKLATPVVYGGGDQPMQAVGNGILSSGTISCTIGTGGQLFSPVNQPVHDRLYRTNTFCHVKNWYILGANLSAGLSLKWLMENILYITDFTKLNKETSKIPSGSEKLLFLPYLNGDRTPHMDANAKGMFFGLQLKHNRYHMLRAVMEGVAFSLRDSLEIFNELQIPVEQVIASGGFIQSDLWMQIVADVFQKSICTTLTKEHACKGAAIMAAVGTKVFNSMEEAVSEMVKKSDRLVEPNEKNGYVYNEQYELFKSLYIQNRELFMI
ncbi:xylulokinase [Bacillus sp. ISL-40]|uniref:xylulokinase n=1 Tax=unclassified Bacillus (in: firmicutes) TaxID=185979 RepID=UPI001BEC03DB|nr:MULTISPECIES: xylulokinase [unclassified Bacillus (in: firmicutes)]MBT2697606.1 xylulokinase [Bacillus sp. ISL-40]MBT2720843.1 xylulokinase [Bacillus sp. ISL-46]MBT2742311.1 xylulokinase [Bacillus sp. ISL-77]